MLTVNLRCLSYKAHRACVAARVRPKATYPIKNIYLPGVACLTHIIIPRHNRSPQSTLSIYTICIFLPFSFLSIYIILRCKIIATYARHIKLPSRSIMKLICFVCIARVKYWQRKPQFSRLPNAAYSFYLRDFLIPFLATVAWLLFYTRRRIFFSRIFHSPFRCFEEIFGAPTVP